MTSVYFDTSVFLAILGGEPTGRAIRDLLRELKRDKVRIHTSIITIQEVSVSSFSHGAMANDNFVKVAKLAKVQGISKLIALTAAKFEAQILKLADKTASKDDKIAENRRRKWDCFHLATALAFRCHTFYAFDKQYGARRTQLGLPFNVERPEPRNPSLLDVV